MWVLTVPTLTKSSEDIWRLDLPAAMSGAPPAPSRSRVRAVPLSATLRARSVPLQAPPGAS